MKNGILLFLLTSLLFLSLTGNANQADTYGRDTANINTWINKCSELIYLSPDSIPVYADSILHIAQDINYNLGLYKGNNYLGISSWMMGKYDDALIYYHKALEYAFLTKDKQNPAVVLSNIALIYNSSYNKDSAKYYLNKSIAYSKENGVYDIYYKSLFDLSNLHLNHDEYIDGYMNLVLASQRPDIEEDSLLLMNIYASFGILYSKVNKFDSSYYYYKKAVKVDSAVEEFDNISNTLINIGHLFLHVKRDPDSARHFYGQALLLAPNYNKKDIELVVNINIANIFLESKELDSAFYYYDKVLNNQK